MEKSTNFFNLEAEQNVIGSMLVDPDSIYLVESMLKADDFFVPTNKNLFTSIISLKKTNTQIDIITVQNNLQKTHQLSEEVRFYILETINNTISTVNIDTYARIVLEKSKRRKASELMKGQLEKLFTGREVEKILQDSIDELTKLATESNSQNFFNQDVNSQVMKVLDYELAQGVLNRIKMGFSKLDEKINSYRKGSLVIIAGRPSMGKTAFALNLFINAIAQKKTAIFYSFEMGLTELYVRLASNIFEKEIRTNSPDELTSAFSDLLQMPSKVSHEKMLINDNPRTTISDIRFQCERIKAKSGLDLVIVDYLQIMSGIDVKSNDTRERIVAEISRSLKILARELDVPIVVLSQLNRGVESRLDKRPMMSDLRDSGAIEQDADLVLLLYREEYYEKDAPLKKGICEVIISKQRNGPTGSVELRYQPEICKFY